VVPQRGRGKAVPPPHPRFTVRWNEPITWTVILVGVLIAILGAHDRIARAIGTAAPSAAVVSTATALSTTANPPVSLASTGGAAPAQAVAPLPNRAPRDPFRALVSPTGTQRPVVALTPIKGQSHGTLPTAPPAAPQGTSNGTSPGATPTTSSNCADGHVVRAGESLWSMAQQHVNKTGQGNVTNYWHRIYAANHQAIGANPSLIMVGVTLCLPP
jgi:hypothetical protein